MSDGLAKKRRALLFLDLSEKMADLIDQVQQPLRGKIYETVAQLVEVAVGLRSAPEPEGSPLRVDSIGTCARCGYHGPGPKHDCNPRRPG